MNHFKQILFVFLCLSTTVFADNIPTAYPEQVGMSSERLVNADKVIEAAIKEGRIPGAVLAVVRRGKMAYLKAYGNRQVVPEKLPMTTNTIFDIASCTKPVATAIATMILAERGLIRVSDPVNMYLPEFNNWHGEGKDTLTIRISHLLTHTSGLPPYAPVSTLKSKNGKPNPDKLMAYIATCKRDFKPQTDLQYSCLNYITLQHIIEKVSHQSLRDFCNQNIFNPLGMRHTDFLPCEANNKGGWVNTSLPKWSVKVEQTADYPIAPTEKQADGSILCGQVHDPLARVMNGGISGNAGLFSTAEDLAVLCAMLQNQGKWGEMRILSPVTVKAMRTVSTDEKNFGRGFGWDVYSPYSSNKGDLLSPEAYGHTGYTGTSIVIDPINDLSIILLTNCVHPIDRTNVIRLRGLVANTVAASITNDPDEFNDYYYKRKAQVEKMPPVKKTDYVMLGNSITEGGYDWNEKLGTKNVVNRGISSDVTMGVYKRLNTILPYHPAKIFLKIGINDVSKDIPTDTIVGRIKRIIERIRKESPKTKLYVHSLLPIREATGRWRLLKGKTDVVPEVNHKLEQMVRQFPDVTYINLFPLFTEPGTNILREELTKDGLHLSEQGYKVWTEVLKKYL